MVSVQKHPADMFQPLPLAYITALKSAPRKARLFWRDAKDKPAELPLGQPCSCLR
jgi:hypothetical protein